MEIKLKGDDGSNDVILSDTGLDNDAYVNIEINEGGMVTGQVLVADLMSAIIAFESRRSHRLAEESLIKGNA